MTVTDTTAPIIPQPSNVSVEGSAPGGAAVSYPLPAATDTVDPHPSVTCSPAAGAFFPLGPHSVGCIATDSAGNQSAPATFTVTVADTTAPSIALPAPVTVEGNTLEGASNVDYGVVTAL